MQAITDADVETQAFELMKELVNITGEKWVSASRFNAMADRFGATDVRTRIAFLAGLKGLVRDMPVKVFTDLDARHAILVAAQEALDAAIDAEEEEAGA